MNINRAPIHDHSQAYPLYDASPARLHTHQPAQPTEKPAPSREPAPAPEQQSLNPFTYMVGKFKELLGHFKQLLGAAPDAPPPVSETAPVQPPKPAEPKPTLGRIGFFAPAPVFAQAHNIDTHAATIKAAMMKFGAHPADVFKSVKRHGDNFTVTMRDGYAVTLTRAELDLVAQRSKFGGDDRRAIDSANFILAAYIKRKQAGSATAPAYKSFTQALDASLRGEFEKRMLEGLGLVAHMRQALPRHMQEEGAIGVISTGYQRSAVVLNGALEIHGLPAGAPSRSYGYVLV